MELLRVFHIVVCSNFFQTVLLQNTGTSDSTVPYNSTTTSSTTTTIPYVSTNVQHVSTMDSFVSTTVPHVSSSKNYVSTTEPTKVCGNLEEGKPYAFLNRQYWCAMDQKYGANIAGTQITTHVNAGGTTTYWQQFYVKKLPPEVSDSYMIYSIPGNLVLDYSYGNLLYLQKPTCSEYQQFAFANGPGGLCYIFANTTTSKLVLSDPNQRSDCTEIPAVQLNLFINGTAYYQLWYFAELHLPSFNPFWPDCFPTTTATTTSKLTTTSHTTTTVVTSTTKSSPPTTTTTTPKPTTTTTASSPPTSTTTTQKPTTTSTASSPSTSTTTTQKPTTTTTASSPPTSTATTPVLTNLTAMYSPLTSTTTTTAPATTTTTIKTSTTKIYTIQSSTTAGSTTDRPRVCGNLEEGKVYTFINSKYQCVIDVYSAYTSAGSILVSYTSHPTNLAANQQWYVRKVESTQDTYMIFSILSKMAADSSGNQLHQQIPSCSLSQQFKFVEGPNGTCYISPVSINSTNMVISTTGQSVNCPSLGPIVVEQFNGSLEQQWTFVENPPPSWTPVPTDCDLTTTVTTPIIRITSETTTTSSTSSTRKETDRATEMSTATKLSTSSATTTFNTILWSKFPPTTNAKTFTSTLSFSSPTNDHSTQPVCEYTDWEPDNFCTGCGKKSTRNSYRKQLVVGIPSELCSPVSKTDSCSHPKKCNPMSGALLILSQILSAFGGFWVCGTLIPSIIIEFILRSKSYESFLHKCEKISLLIAHLFILFGLTQINNPVTCQITTVCLQFLFTSTFCFFFFEALQSYCIFTKVICHGSVLSKRMTMLVCLVVPLIITTATVFSGSGDLQSDFACWINVEQPIAFGSFVPIAIISVVTIIITEAALTCYYPLLPFTSKTQMHSANVNRHAMIIKFPLFCGSWFSMVFASYYQQFFLFPICFALNTSLGWKLLFFHLVGHDKVVQKVKSVFRKFCKK